ncbi:TPA: hypothetical protein ACH3X1_011682 [Trebouxia sp. C0004]
MAPKSARQAAKAKAMEAESSKTAPADSLGDELAKLKVSLSLSLSTFSEKFMSQIDKAHCDTAIQTAKTSVLETGRADLQAAASNTNALTTQSADPIQQRLNTLGASVEQGEHMRRSTSMIVKCNVATS